MARDKSPKKLLLIDGNSLFHRAYHALPPITDKSGEVANAVFGFSNMLLKAINEVKPNYIACAFDTAAPTFRHMEFEKYKAQRVEPPPDLYPQLPKVKKVLEAFGISFFEKEGFEADDILATIATRGSRRHREHSRSVSKIKARSHSGSEAMQVVILSGDRDVLQLVNGNVKVQMPGWNLKESSLYGAKEVKKKYGITPAQMVDYKSLMGDASDNIPGIAGVGPKAASNLLIKYKTLENLFKHLDDIEGSVKGKLEAGEQDALKAKKLVELDRNVNLQFTINDLRFDPNWDEVRDEYQRLGFKSIAAKLPGADKDEPEVTNESKEPNVKNNQNQLELV